MDRMLLNRALYATADEAFAKKLVGETTINEVETAAFVELGEIALRELKLQSRYLPLIACGTVALGTGVRYGFALKSVNKMCAEKDGKENPQTPNPKPQ